MAGAGLAFLALSLAGGLRRAVIPATDTAMSLMPCGTSPLLDPLFSTEDVIVEHDRLHLTRHEKVAWLAEHHPELLPFLKVCFAENRPDNCGRCAKCLLTMAALVAAGALERASGFPDRIDLAALDVVRMDATSLNARYDVAEAARAPPPDRAAGAGGAPPDGTARTVDAGSADLARLRAGDERAGAHRGLARAPPARRSPGGRTRGGAHPRCARLPPPRLPGGPAGALRLGPSRHRRSAAVDLRVGGQRHGLRRDGAPGLPRRPGSGHRPPGHGAPAAAVGLAARAGGTVTGAPRRPSAARRRRGGPVPPPRSRCSRRPRR